MYRKFVLYFLSVLFLLSTTGRAETQFWRTVWPEELVDSKGAPLEGAAREKYLQLLSDAYGAQLYVMPKRKPKEPVQLPGVVYHDSIYDEGYVKGDKNPQLLANDAINKINKTYHLDDLDEKWDEFKFLREFLPKQPGEKLPRLAPPEMHLASDYTGELNAKEREIAEKSYEALIAKYSTPGGEQAKLLKTAQANKENLVRLFTIQHRINGAPGMGRSILKIRTANHSEGKLPKTDKDWGDLFVHYLAETKHLIHSDTSPEELLEMRYVEGRILDRMLGKRPDDVIVQHMVKIRKEMRVHIVDGEILDGATFLRFYHLNEYLKDEDIKTVEEALKRDLLPKLRKAGLEHYSGSPDVAILEDGSVKILDFNDGLYSGYLMPTEDLFTTNLFAQRFSGKPTTFINEFEAFKALPWGPEKTKSLKHFRGKYKEFMKGDVSQAFWDRVNKHQMELLSKEPSPDKFRASLELMKEGGLHKPLIDSYQIYLQFIAEVQDRWPTLVLPRKEAQEWADYINGLVPEEEHVVVSIDANNHFKAVEMNHETVKAPEGTRHTERPVVKQEVHSKEVQGTAP